MHARTHCGCGDLHEAKPTLQAALTGLRGLPKRRKEKKKEDMKMGRGWVGVVLGGSGKDLGLISSRYSECVHMKLSKDK